MSIKPYAVHADPDKPHRCPACRIVAVHDGPVMPWRLYTCCGCEDTSCGCGQQFAQRPWLPYLDDETGHPVRYALRAARDSSWMFRHRWRTYGISEAFSACARYVRRTALFIRSPGERNGNGR